MNQLLSGAITMAYLVAGLFFLRFWKRSKDRLFVFFSVAFFILAAQKCALALVAGGTEDSTGLYVVRLFAFILILIGIWEKNR